jgi:hypothetical protein
MELPEFKLDNYRQRYVYKAKYQIRSSSVQPLKILFDGRRRILPPVI